MNIIPKGTNAIVEISNGNYKQVSYEALLRAAGAGKRNRSNKSKSAGTKFSRFVSLTEHAIRTGTWTTGGKVDIQGVLGRLTDAFMKLTPEEIEQVTETGVEKLTAIADSEAVGQWKPTMVKILNRVMVAKGA